MKLLILCVLFVASVSAQWYPTYPRYAPAFDYGFYGRSGIIGYPGYPVPVASQYHTQDIYGRAAYGYSYPGQAASNYRDAAGNQIGYYGYTNPEGKNVHVSYTADHRGFRVASNDLPVSPVANLVAPLPVQETPEVVAAKAALAKAYQEKSSRTKRQINPGYDMEWYNWMMRNIENPGEPNPMPKTPGYVELPYYPSYGK